MERTKLTSKRIKVLKPSISDLEDYCELFRDPDVMRHIGYRQIRSQADTKDYLKKAIAHWDKHGFGFGLLLDNETREFIGDAGLVHLGLNDQNEEIELGYRLHKKFWGKGYATEAALAWLEWGFAHLPVTSFIATCYPDNIASQKVLEKAGMHFEKMDLYPGTENMSMFYRILRESSSL